MSLYIASINSGSNGNCYYVGNEEEAVLIDAGLSCRETEKRMARMGLSLQKVKGLFISHEHSDHISGVEVISKKYNIPVFITPDTLRGCRIAIKEHLNFSFAAYQPVQVGGLSVTAFPKRHDAAHPHSFIVSGNGVNIGVLTDIGLGCAHVKENFSYCHAAFLEANYDEQMLAEGHYPYHLKKRISGDEGHLSNAQALELFVNHKSSYLSHLLLSHLSKENNCPQKAQELFSSHAGTTHVAVASRYQESEVYYIEGSANQPKQRKLFGKEAQTSFSFF